jgi:DNA-binding transcriptional ArsR family regulator
MRGSFTAFTMTTKTSNRDDAIKEGQQQIACGDDSKKGKGKSQKSLDRMGWVGDNLRLVDAYLQAGLDALGDGTRRAIFQRLANGPMAVNELAGTMTVSRPAVSQHLRVLKDAGLVTDRKDGTRRMYQLDPEGVARLRAHFDQVWERALGAIEKGAASPKGGEKHDKNSRSGSGKKKHSGSRVH